MFDALIQGSLRRPWLVLGAALLLLGLAALATRRLPVDVLPDLSAPSVTIVTETEGLAPEEAERIVTLPIEQALGGAAGVRRIRSSTGIG
ncbi:MAG TPA: efflux RND transporter permease subunit, partial [Polyangiaceae bacterium]